MNIRTALFALALAAALPLAAQAASGAVPQGFDAPAAAQASQDKAPQGFGPTTPTTVENVIKNGADDEYVILRGRFTSHIKSDKYEFQDEAGGVITAELDHDRNWSMVHRGKLMEIRAKVDRDWNSTKLDVKSAKPLE